MKLVLQEHVYQQLVDQFLTEFERVKYPDTGVRLGDGRVEFDIGDKIASAMQDFMLPDEGLAEAVERLMVIAGGKLS
ncbi:hypothetical protein ACRAVF_33975 (plasmid) [Bradyrhizobium oligotrophicum S58]